MPNLSQAGSELVRDLAQRHGVSTDAVVHMLIAVRNGQGTMAQFSHPEFGGSGQWMRGGMTMVSDLFNHQLKSRVDHLCSDISRALADHQSVPFSGSFQSQSQSGGHSQTQAAGGSGSSNRLFEPDPDSKWWPGELGAPNATGSQNNVRYAYFANAHRLAVKTGNDIWVYDTLNHQIGGFSQQQGGGTSITFSSQYGTVDLSTLPVISRNGVQQSGETGRSGSTLGLSSAGGGQSAVGGGAPAPSSAASDSSGPLPNSPTDQRQGEDIIGTLERLGGLLQKGYITNEEFAAKKAELLKRL